MQQKLNYATLCLHVKESYKACKESDKAYGESCKACEERGKAPCENPSKPPFQKKDFFLEKDFLLFYK